MVEVEAIGVFVSPLRRERFLVGVSVRVCNRELSPARGRIGEGGRSKRGGVGFESEGGFVLAIGGDETEVRVDNRGGGGWRLCQTRCRSLLLLQAVPTSCGTVQVRGR